MVIQRIALQRVTVFLATLLAGRGLVIGQAVTPYFNNLQGFNSAAGSPPIAIDFEAIAANSNITGQALNGVTFQRSSTGAQLIVVRAADTFTSGGFINTPNPASNVLPATSGQNVLSPGGITLGPGPNNQIENDDLDITFNPPVTSVGFDVLFQEIDLYSWVTITVFGPGGTILYSNFEIPTGYPGPGDGGGGPAGKTFVGFIANNTSIARLVVDERDGDNYFPDSNIGFDSFRFSPAVVSRFESFYGDLEGFNAAADNPPIVVGFFDPPVNPDITNRTISGVTFKQPAGSSGAPLIVTRASATLTPGGFINAVDPARNRFYATSGELVLSPGGPTLGPGPNPTIENDDLELVFDPPVSAIGFDLLLQEWDCCSRAGITVYGPANQQLHAQNPIPTGYEGTGPVQGFGGGGGYAGKHLFIGFVSSQANIHRIVLDEYDSDSFFPDSNVGYDTFRFTSDEPAFSTVLIDVLPGEFPNTIDIAAGDLVPVSIISSHALDATTVKPASIRFAGAGVAILPTTGAPDCWIEDSNGDGIADFTCHFASGSLVLSTSHGTTALQAWTVGGERLRGEDQVSAVSAPVPRRERIQAAEPLEP